MMFYLHGYGGFINNLWWEPIYDSVLAFHSFSQRGYGPAPQKVNQFEREMLFC